MAITFINKKYFLVNILLYIIYTIASSIFIVILIYGFNFIPKPEHHIDERLLLFYIPFFIFIYNLLGILLSSMIFTKKVITIILWVLFIINAVVVMEIFQTFLNIIFGNIISCLLVMIIYFIKVKVKENILVKK
ncbi:MAG: hypothetical protein FWB73_02150 [Treponema sp.]|nr:hypothetical protein [Treponema sp.]